MSNKDTEVDKAKIEVIERLPSPNSVKGVQSFLGHAGLYRLFIKDFSKIARPLTELRAKDALLFLLMLVLRIFPIWYPTYVD